MPFYSDLQTKRRSRLPGLDDDVGLDAYMRPEDYLSPPAEMTFDVGEYTNPVDDAYAAGIQGAQGELAAPLPALGAVSAPAPAPMANPAPAPAVAGTPPAMAPPMVPPSSPQAAQPTGAGALPPPPGNPAAPPQQGSLASIQAQNSGPPINQQPQEPPPQAMQPTPGNDSDAGSLNGLWSPGGGPGTPQQRMAKSRALPGLDPGASFGQTKQETADLARARLGDRRMRIGQGVTQGIGALLGAIGAGTGNMGLMGAGMGIGSIGRAIPAGRREESALADIERRQQGAAAQVAAQQRAQQLGTDAERVGVQRIGAEANMVRAQGQAQLDAANAANAEFERAAAEGNAEGMRGAIRARIAAMPDSDPRKAVLAAQHIAGGPSDIDQLSDMASLGRVLESINDIDSRSGRIEQMRGGSVGGGSQLRWVPGHDGQPGRYVETTTPGRRTGPSGPAVTDPFANPATAAPPIAPAVPDSVPVQARTRPTGGRGRQPAVAPAPAPAPATVGGTAPAAQAADGGYVVNTGLEGDLARYSRALTRLGIDPESQAGRDELEQYSALYREGTDGARARAQSKLQERIAAASEAEATGLIPGTTPEQRRLANASEFQTAMQQRGRIARLIPQLERALRDHPEDFALAARYVGTGQALPPNASAIAQQMAQDLVPRLKEMSGATVTDSELARTLQAFGLGDWSTVLGNPRGYIRAMQQGLELLVRETNARVSGGIGWRAAAPIYRQYLGGRTDDWGQRLARLNR